MNYRNMVGSQLRKLRYARGWSQNVLAAKLQILGLDITRGDLAKIESRLAHVDDFDLLYITRVFRVGVADLFPEIGSEKRIHEAISELIQRKRSKKSS